MARQYYQGKFRPINESKYIGSKVPIYRSSWELKAFTFFDNHPDVIKWNSEGIVIPYVSPKDNKVHRYFVDLYVELKTKNGETSRKIIEIKPYTQCKQPRRCKSDKKYAEAILTYKINLAKWDAARLWAKKHSVEFVIFTEYELGIKKRKQ